MEWKMTMSGLAVDGDDAVVVMKVCIEMVSKQMTTTLRSDTDGYNAVDGSGGRFRAMTISQL